MSDAAHRRTERVIGAMEKRIERLFRDGAAAFFDELNIAALYLDDDGATQRQRLIHADKAGRIGAEELLIALIVSAMSMSGAVIQRGAAGIYEVNYRYITGLYGKGVRDGVRSGAGGRVARDGRLLNDGEAKARVGADANRRFVSAVRGGYDPDGIKSEVRRAFRKWKNISTAAARTEATGAENRGRLDAMNAARAMGADIAGKRWASVLDKVTRDSHIRMDGETAGLGDRFSNGLMYPGDPDGALEEIINCRCTIYPVDRAGMAGMGSDVLSRFWQGV